LFFVILGLMSYITSIGTAVPPYKFSQATLADFMTQAMLANDEEAQKLKVIFRATGIDTRHSVLSDYGKSFDFSFYSNANDFEPFPSTKRRLDLFKQESLTLSLASIQACLQKVKLFDKQSITHLVVVSCTGMYAPGLDIDLIKHLDLSSNVKRICINFMGCYAAFNALKLADSFCQVDPQAKVLVVCTELCSIHFQKQATEDNMLANALFADGSAAMLVQGRPEKGLNLKPISFYCDLAPDGEQDMAWTVGDWGFEMRLSAYVPAIIRQGIKKLTNSLLQQISHRMSDIAYYAIHPGGKKILEVIEQELALTKQQNKSAYTILRQFGNMSSPTVLFVLQDIFEGLTSSDADKKILSFAFGPGLTLESMILEIQQHD
jgi:prepilin-type processing-associated H-X9-DG protein